MRLFKFLLLFSITSLFLSCEKTEQIQQKDGQVGVSRITYFPTFTMKGDRYLSIVKGETFTDPGVTAKEGAEDIKVQVSPFDTNTPGVYDIVYTATNKDGFTSSITRTVAVLPAAPQPGSDISGRYANVGSFNYVSTIQQLAPGFYITDNVWGGASAALISAYILTVDGTNWLLPVSTISPYGRVSGTGTLAADGNLTYSISLLDLGLSNSVRKWKKQ